jgi:beta-lactamase regulating signal transducer with metallopeptidase domain
MQSLLEVALSNAILACMLAVVALVVGLITRRPALVHALWLLVLVKLITPPIFRVSVPWPSASGSASVAAHRDSDPAPVVPELEVEDPPLADPDEPLPEMAAAEQELALVPAPKQDFPDPPTQPPAPTWLPWPQLLASLWLFGTLSWFALAARRAWLFSDALSQASLATSELRERVAELARLVGLFGCPEVRMVPARVTPMVWGVFRPVLLMPAGLKEKVGQQGTDTLVVHELAHIRRRDHWVRVLEFVVLGLFWWHPVAWLARREMRQAEERCCDAWVVRVLPTSARAYAVALVNALDFLSDSSPVVPPLSCGIGDVADLKRRLKMILRSATPHRLGLTAGLAVLGLAFFVLPLLPALAQQEREKPMPRDEQPEHRKHDGDHVERMKDELRKKMADIERLQDQIQKTMKEREAARHKEEKGHGKGVQMIRIEISGLDGKPEDIKKLVETLEKMLPGKERRILVLRAGHQPGQPHPGVHPQPRPQPGQPRIEIHRPAAPGQPQAPIAPRPPHAPVPTHDKRIDGLEKKLDGIMRELELLRGEMKRRGTPEKR